MYGLNDDKHKNDVITYDTGPNYWCNCRSNVKCSKRLIGNVDLKSSKWGSSYSTKLNEISRRVKKIVKT